MTTTMPTDQIAVDDPAVAAAAATTTPVVVPAETQEPIHCDAVKIESADESATEGGSDEQHPPNDMGRRNTSHPDDDGLGCISRQRCREEGHIFSRRMKEKLMVLLLSGFVAGWCFTGVDALASESRADLQDLCSGTILWDLLLTMLVVNVACAVTMLHIWYNKHFHNIDVYPNTNIPIHGVIFIQILMTVAGASTLFTKCAVNHLKPFLVYSVVYVWIIWQLFLLFLSFVVGICLCCVLSGWTV